MKKRILLILLFQLAIFVKNYANEFLYPIEQFQKNQERLYVLYQKNILHLELWSMDLKTNLARKELMSSYNPAGIASIPNGRGFSFIDNGRIKLKYFNKRSPINFEFEFPVYDFHKIEWLNDEFFYFSAKAGKRFCIFMCNATSKKVKNLINSHICSRTNDDYMYPQIVDGKIFFISKSVHKIAESNYETFGNYKIMVANLENNFEVNQKLDVVLRKGEQAIAFLKMKSEDEGFFISHPNKISKQNKILHLKYFHLRKTEQGWEYNKLFDFNVPLKYLTRYSEVQLHESILPFLPKHYDNKIYYPSCKNRNNLSTDILEYDLSEGKFQILVQASWPETYFSPVKVGNYLYFGGTCGANINFRIGDAPDQAIYLDVKRVAI